MVLDSSAVICILFREPGYKALVGRISSERRVIIGAPTLLEATIVASSRLKKDARGVLGQFLSYVGATVMPFSTEHCSEAVDAFLRFGKGRHPAALNLGDCMAYAIAKLSNDALLFVGNDFSKTDISG